MRKVTKTNQRGFTIIELLLALTFFSFLLIFATASFIQINRSFVRGANVKLVQEEARKVIGELSTALREHGSGTRHIQDNDDMVACDPRSSAAAFDVNIPGGFDVGPTDPATKQYDCRHRLCVGSTVYAWNQSIYNDGIDEHSWLAVGASFFPYDYRDNAIGDPFSVIKTVSDGTSKEACLENINYLDSVSLVDSKRVMVQDIDIYLLDPLVSTDTYVVRVSLSTKDSNYTDAQDLKYPSSTGIDTDSNPTPVKEFKAEGCNTDKGSQEFCYVETLSTIVTTR